jgi:hypothetical protein
MVGYFRGSECSAASLIRGIEHSKTATNHRIFENVISKADARREIRLLIGNQALRCIAINGDLGIEIRRQWIRPAGCDIQRVGIDVEISLN